MLKVTTELSRDIKELEIHIFADEHIGDDNCDLNRLKQRIDYVKNNKNAYCILNGDILDYASRSSIGDIETREFNIMGQLEKAVELFGPIKDKILCVNNGNHENRSYRKEGVDMSKMIAMQLGLVEKYSPTSTYLYIKFGTPKKNHGGKNEKLTYTIYCLHGSGGGRKEGAKAIRLADMASIVDADVYIHSHTHLPMIMKQGYYRSDKSHLSLIHATRLFVNNSANLHYGGYGEAQEFKPSTTDTPTIYLNGEQYDAQAKL